MKKYLVLAILLLAAVIILFQFKTKKTNTIPQFSKAGEELKIGKEIQKDTTPPPVTQTTSSSYIQTTGCNKTFENIISEYGKEWGSTKREITFTQEEIDKIMKLITDYIECEAIVSKNPSKCELFIPIKKYCIHTYYNYQFNEFFIGANKNEEDCKKYIDILKENMRDPIDKEILLLSRKVGPDKLCSEIKNDIRGICDRLFTNTSERKQCYNVFPKDIIKRCPLSSEEACTNAYENAKKTGVYGCDLFEEGNRKRCEIRKMGINACSEKLNKLLITYCSYMENLNKKIAELEEKKKMEEEKKKMEEEKIKREEEIKKLENEIIKKAKQAAEEAKKFKGRKNVDEE